MLARSVAAYAVVVEPVRPDFVWVQQVASVKNLGLPHQLPDTGPVEFPKLGPFSGNYDRVDVSARIVGVCRRVGAVGEVSRSFPSATGS